MAKNKNKIIIKNPSGSGNISITKENNLKSTNPPIPKPVKRRRTSRPTDNELENSKINDMLKGGGISYHRYRERNVQCRF